MIVDFHTHTLMSDGALSPAELLRRAVDRGVEQLSITDHDTLAAYEQLPVPESIKLVPGIELSCAWRGVTVHVLGLNVQPDAPALKDAVSSQEQAREQRAVQIGERLAQRGIEGMFDAARHEAGTRRALGRPDFARALLARGAVTSVQQAFNRYLGAGKIGDVKSHWPALTEVAQWITGSGGVAVLAHPLHYKLTRTKLRLLVTDFMAAGGRGLEVANGRQWTTQELHSLQALCRDFGLVASVGSDFHADSRWSDVGCDAALVGECVPVWRTWE